MAPFSLPLKLAGAGEDCGGGLEAAATSLGAAGDEAGAVLRWKKPKMLFCCFADCDAEDVDFWSLGTRGVAISLPSMPRAMLNLVESGMSRQWLTTEKWSTRLRFGERARVRVSIWRVSEMADGRCYR